MDFSGNFFRLAFLITFSANVGFSQLPIHIDIRNDIPSNGHWVLDCPSGYQELVGDFNCRDWGRVDLPDGDNFGQKGFWTKCLDRCRITYYVQPGDNSFAARVYLRNLPLEISYDGVSWEFEDGDGWMNIEKNLDPSITQISMEFNHLHEEFFVLLDKIAVNAGLPPLDPTISTTENSDITIPTTSTESQTTEVEPSSATSESSFTGTTLETTLGSTPETETTLGTSLGTSETTMETTLGTSETTMETSLGTSETTMETSLGTSETTMETSLGTSETTMGTTLEATSDTSSETTLGATSDITSDTTLVTMLETTYETTTLGTTVEPSSEGTSGATMDPETTSEEISTPESITTPRTTFVTQTSSSIPSSPHPPIGTESTTISTPPTGEASSTPRRTRSTTPAAGPPSSSKWADFFKGKWGILLLSFLGAIISTILIILCARCICMRYGMGTRMHRKKKSDLERILSRSDSTLNQHSEMPRNQNVSQVTSTNPRNLSPSAFQGASHNPNPYPRAILRESTPYRAFNQRQQQDSIPIYESP